MEKTEKANTFTCAYCQLMFEESIEKYELLRAEYQKKIITPMAPKDYFEYAEIMFSAHSCSIEGNSFSVDDTRELKEKGLGMIPKDKSLYEAFEILDHFCAFEYMMERSAAKAALDETLLCETNRLCTLHTLPYRVKGAVPGRYTDTDMAAGDTIFGDHVQLIAKVPALLSQTEKALADGIHPMVVSARFHGFYEYLHPFRDGNGRTGRLISNFILQKANHPLLIIRNSDKDTYISALRMIRREGTDEFLVNFFFDCAIRSMSEALSQKTVNTRKFKTFLF